MLTHTHACVCLDAWVCIFMQLTEHLLYASTVLGTLVGRMKQTQSLLTWT